MNITRRGFLQGMLALGAAPAVVKAVNLMPVKSSIIAIPTDEEFFAIMHPSHNMRDMHRDRLAKWWADQIDKIVFETLSKGAI
jgi:hypothetical protein